MGNEQTYGKIGIANTFNQFLNPGIYKPKTTDPVALELEKVTKSQGSNMLPNLQTYKFTNNKKEIKLDNKEVSEFQRIQGEYAKEKLDSLFKSATYKNYTDEQKADSIGAIFDVAYKVAKNETMKNRGD